MGELKIKNFRYGLDTRRSQLTAVLGTFQGLNNAYITEGGEVHQRKDFTKVALPSGTFGLQATTSGLLTFGSADPTTGSPSINASLITASVLLGITISYQRLQHPAVSFLGATYSASYHAMTSVKWSQVHKGNSFVAASFTDGSTFLFYNGVVIGSTYWGKVFFGGNVASPGSKTTTTRRRTSNVAILGVVFPNVELQAGDLVTINGLGGTGYNSGTSTVVLTAADLDTVSYSCPGGDEGVTADTGGTVLEVLVGGWGTQTLLQESLVDQLRLNVAQELEAWVFDEALTVEGHTVGYPGDAAAGGVLLTPDGTTVAAISATVVGDGDLGYLYMGTQAATSVNKATATVTISGAAGDKFQLFASVITPYTGTAIFNLVVDYSAGSDYVAWITDNATTATAIATAVNANTAITGYTAVADGANVVITAPSVTSALVYNAIVAAPVYTPTSVVLRQYSSAFDVSETTGDFSGGVQAVPESDSLYEISFVSDGNNKWAIGDTWRLNVVDDSGTTFTLGCGRICGDSFPFGFVYGDRAYLANGASWNISAVGNLTQYEQQHASAAEFTWQSELGEGGTVQAFAPFQGKMAVFGTKSVQIRNIAASPVEMSLFQTLSGVGTRSPFSVRSLGELETLFLASNGFRSLRSRMTTLLAFPTDLGSPIDSIVQAKIAASTATQIGAACGIAEPGSNRYWCFLNDTIYVLSYFPTNEIVAWSTFSPTTDEGDITLTLTGTAANGTLTIALRMVNDAVVSATTTSEEGVSTPTTVATALAAAINAWTTTHGYTATSNAGVVTIVVPAGVYASTASTKITTNTTGLTVTLAGGHTAFIPQKFEVFNDQIYIRSSDAIYQYGGSTGLSYGDCQVEWELPCLDLEEPSTDHSFESFDMGLVGAWHVLGSTNPKDGTFEVIGALGNTTSPDEAMDSSFDEGDVGFRSIGTRIKLKGTSYRANTSQAKLTCLTIKYN